MFKKYSRRILSNCQDENYPHRSSVPRDSDGRQGLVYKNKTLPLSRATGHLSSCLASQVDLYSIFCII